MHAHAASTISAEPSVAKCQLHGVLVQVFGVGVLLTGESGVGKTTCAMELLRRGHTLVADDAVQILQQGGYLFGRAPEITRSLLHVRGSGIMDVKDVFDPSIILDDCRIDIRIEIGSDADHKTQTTITEIGLPLIRLERDLPFMLADKIESIAGEHIERLVN